MSLRLGLFALTVSALALASPLAAAETRAVVVGVSDYPALKPDRWLKGPRRDALQVARTITELGIDPANVKLLADGLHEELPEGIEAPVPGTKAAILAALDKVVEETQAGDLVFFFFSGHGSQQPDFDGDEGGGGDEIFLPYDVKSWSTAGVENGLLDDELNERVRKVLAKGADFFGMVDACHSATGFRAAPGVESPNKYIDPQELGVPADAFTEAATGAPAPAPEPSEGRGRAAFFYAAQENEAALEMPARNGDPDEFYSVFTYNVLKRLRQNPAVTYRTLHQAVVNDIKRGTMMQTQTPEVEGDLVDEPVLRLSAAAPTRQWPIFAGNLRAGELSGVVPGAVVALFNDPADADDQAVARGTVTIAGATKAVVSQIDWPCGDDGACTPDAEAFKKARFARIAEPGLDFTLSLSKPVRVDPQDGHDYAPALAALETAVSSPSLSKRVALKGDAYDIAVGLVDGKLAFSGAAGLIDPYGPGSSPRLTLSGDPAIAASEVTDAVRRMAQALALQRLATATDGGGGLGLTAQLSVRKAKPGSIVDGGCAEDDDAYELPVPAGDSPGFDECDIVSVSLDNKGGKALDVTVLLVGSDFSITTAWPQEGAANRVRSREVKTADILQMEAEPVSALQERLVVIAVPGINQSHTAFDNLEQDGLRAGIDPASPGAAAARELLAVGLTDMSRSTAAGTEKLSEELAVEIRPFLARKGGGA
ncbi:MAG: caspase domain-containing protein [Rhizobiaceae bacterium]